MTTSHPKKYRLAPYRPVEMPDLVRVGRAQDGGYVTCMRALERTKLLVSGGIFVDWSFESDFLAKAASSKLLAFDGSVSRRRFLSITVAAVGRTIKYAVLRHRALYHWHARGVAYGAGLTFQFLKFFGRPGRYFKQLFLGVKDSGKTVSWSTVRRMQPVASVENVALGICWKLDIEGAEFEFLPTILRDARLFNSLILEFHNLDTRWEEFEALMHAVMQDFAVIHLHGNNFAPLIPNTSCPSVLEVTLLNRALLPPDVSFVDATLPRVGLDFANDPTQADYPIEF